MYCIFERERDSFFIETIREEDFPELASLVGQFPGAYATAEGIEGTLRRQEYVAWVARREAGRRMVGFVLLRVHPGYRDIVAMGVHPSCQRQGIGSAMVDLLKKVAADHALTVGCHAFDRSREIDQLLIKRGFVASDSDLSRRYPSRPMATGYLFCGELHDNPESYRWEINSVAPEFVGKPACV